MTRALPKLWLCADLDHPAARELVSRVSAVLSVVSACVWLRGVGEGGPRSLLATACALRALTAREGCALVVGARIDVAALAQADGVHLPARSFAPDGARRILSGALWLSTAVHDEMQIDRARGHVDAMVLSPFRAVPGKGRALGVEGFSALRARAGDSTVLALGGIASPGDVRAALAAGADGVAVRRALMDSPDPAGACAALAEVLASHRG